MPVSKVSRTIVNAPESATLTDLICMPGEMIGASGAGTGQTAGGPVPS